jgi:hypothetical protein
VIQGPASALRCKVFGCYSRGGRRGGVTRRVHNWPMGPGEVGARWQRLGEGGSEREWDSAAQDPDRWARQYSAGRFGFKPVQTDLNLLKLWLVQKVSSRAPKIGNKIWMERAWDEKQLCLKNFPHIWNGFGTKIQRTSMSWISIEIYWKFLELYISMKFGQQAPFYTLLPGKINFHQKRIKNLNSIQKGKLDWFDDSLNPKLYF